MSAIPAPSPIRLRRVISGYSQAQLAERAGIRRETVSRLEHGAEPRLSTARAIADAFGVDIAIIFPVDSKSPAVDGALATNAEAPAHVCES